MHEVCVYYSEFLVCFVFFPLHLSPNRFPFSNFLSLLFFPFFWVSLQGNFMLFQKIWISRFFMTQLSVTALVPRAFKAMVVFQKKLHLWKPKSMQFSFTFLTDSTVLGLEYRNLSKVFSNYTADTKEDNRTKYVYFISITENKIEEKVFYFSVIIHQSALFQDTWQCNYVRHNRPSASVWEHEGVYASL